MKNISNEAKIEFLSKSSNESFARICVSGFVSSLDPTIEELSDIKTAVSEAVTNSIVHGYENKQGMIYMVLRILDERILEVTISDLGRGIEDIEQARQPLFSTSKDKDRSGMGFTVMETFMDGLHIESELSKGTTITMIKRLS